MKYLVFTQYAAHLLTIGFHLRPPEIVMVSTFAMKK